MPAHEPNPAREARTGILTLAIVLGVAMLAALLSNVSWQRPMIYRVGFRVNQDATGVQPGTPITLGGLEWGHVTRVQHGVVPSVGVLATAVNATQRDVTRGTLVTFEIDPRIRLMPGARISRAASFLGSGVELVITDTGLTRGSTDLLPLQGRDKLSEEMVLSASSPAEGPTVLLGLRTAAKLKSIPTTFDTLRKAILADAVRTAATGAPPVWADRIDSIRASWSHLQDLFAAPTQGRRTLGGDIDRISTELKPSWNATWDSMQDLTDRARAAWEPRGERLWKQARDEWKNLERLWQQLKSAGDDTIDTYHDFMANSSLMGGQIRLTFEQPIETTLRLFFGKPGESGMMRMRRYEAASRLAIATADLRDANDALEWLANATKPVDPQVAADLRAQAARAAEAFAAAIERLVKLSQQP